MATSDTGQVPSRLFYLIDHSLGLHFLKTWMLKLASSLLHLLNGGHGSDGFSLQAINHTPIPTFGKHSLTLHLGLKHQPLQWVFLVADVSSSIMGVDFLKSHSLLVDICHKCLVDPLTNLWVQALVTPEKLNNSSSRI